jgi:hypothetical protein
LQGGSFNEWDRIARQLEAIEGKFEEISIRIKILVCYTNLVRHKM